MRPILVQIKLKTEQHEIRDFDIEYKEKGSAQTFEKIIAAIFDYVRDP